MIEIHNKGYVPAVGKGHKAQEKLLKIFWESTQIRARDQTIKVLS